MKFNKNFRFFTVRWTENKRINVDERQTEENDITICKLRILKKKHVERIEGDKLTNIHFKTVIVLSNSARSKTVSINLSLSTYIENSNINISFKTKFNLAIYYL